MFTNNAYATPFTMPVMPAGGTGFSGGTGWGNDWISLAIIAMIFGWGGFGGGYGFGGGGAGAMQNYVLGSDFATIQRQLSDGFNSIDNALDAQNSGICNLGYTALEQNAATNMAMMQGNNALATQLADCCCKTQSGIERINTGAAMNTAAIQEAIKDCCCQEQAQFAQTRYDLATQNNATLQAIDKVGDRIIDFMCSEKAQALRDENFALKLQASQSMQNNYLIGQLAPKQPVPAYIVQNPYCQCNGGYPYGFYGNGATIA